MNYQTNPQLELAENYLRNTNVSLFLTGKAGTGKTTFLHNVLQRLNKRYVVTAPTGVAAINAGGVTIHSFFQLPLCPYLPDVPELVTEYQMPEGKRQLRKTRANIIRTLDLLVIDEISMVRADLLDAIDYSLRRYRRNPRPFGGVQLLMIGDIHQLSPVVTADEEPYIKQVYASPFFFESKAFKKLDHITIELTTVYRQQDPRFLDLLNRVRDNRLDKETLQLLNDRYQPDTEAYIKTLPETPIRLTTHNVQANRVNHRNLEKIQDKERIFRASVTGNFPESAYPAEKELRLKTGAQVMFIKNDPSGQANYYNGKIGTVKSFDTEANLVFVESEGNLIAVAQVEWENMKYEIDAGDNSIKQVIDGTFVQFPLRLAWAVTIHKAQGLTFDRVIVDAADAFAYGQVYVALSRCRSLEGLALSSRITQNAAYTNSDVEAFGQSQISEDEARQNYPVRARQYYVDTVFDMLSPKELFDAALRIDQFNRAYLTDMAPAAVKQWNEWMPRLTNLDDVCAKFRNQVTRICADQTQPDQTEALLAERVAKAAAYFESQYSAAEETLLPLLDIDIDNKENAKKHKEYSNNFRNLIVVKTSCLKKMVADGFTVERYLKAKCDCMLENEDDAKATEKKNSGNRRDRRNETSERTANIYDLEHPEIVAHLVAWRREKYEELGVPAFLVLHQKTLLAIAKAMPRTTEQLLAVKGMGKTKVKAYGSEIVEVINDFCHEKGI